MKPRTLFSATAVFAALMCGATAARAQIALTVVVSPATATNMVSTNHVVTATVKDDVGVLVVGATVQFAITGANVGATCTEPGGNVQSTNANGQATCTYQGVAAGPDTITATAVVLNPLATGQGSAGKTWVNPAIALAPPSDTNPVGTPHTVTATVSVPPGAGGSLSSAQVTFSVTGANPQGSTVVTTTAGGGGTRVADYTYTGTNVGMDTINASVSNVNGISTTGGSTTATKNWGPPTAATVISLNGSAVRAGVRLVWTTAVQLGFLGFYVWRTGEGSWKPVSSLIRAKHPDGAGSAAYSFVDRRARNGRAYGYRLQIVRLDGSRVWAGSIKVRLP